MIVKDPEGVENIVTVISEGEWMNDGVKMDRSKHDWNDCKHSQQSRETPLLCGEAVVQERREELLRKKYVGDRKDENGPGKEHKVRPDVEHLG